MNLLDITMQHAPIHKIYVYEVTVSKISCLVVECRHIERDMKSRSRIARKHFEFMDWPHMLFEVVSIRAG